AGRGPVEDELREVWRVPDGLNGEIVLLEPHEDEGGALRLVAWDQPGEPMVDHLGGRTVGHFALNFRARDVRALLPRLAALGAPPPRFRPPGPPSARSPRRIPVASSSRTTGTMRASRSGTR